MSDSLSDYVTTKQAAELLGIRHDSVHHLLLAGRLPGKKIGSTWLVSKPSIEEYFLTKSPGEQPPGGKPKLVTAR